MENIFTAYNLEILIRLVLALVLGGVIGLERAEHHQFAGLRTHILVCVGSAAVMIAGDFAVKQLGLQTDATRMGAQVISGIGFLGAGAILTSSDHHKIKGLTTAAGLWATACMGLLVGIGAYIPAAVTTALVLVAVFGLRPISNKITRRNYYAVITLNYKNDIDLKEVFKIIYNAGVRKGHLEEISSNMQDNTGRAVIKVNIQPEFSYRKILNDLKKAGCILDVSCSFLNGYVDIV